MVKAKAHYTDYPGTRRPRLRFNAASSNLQLRGNWPKAGGEKCVKAGHPTSKFVAQDGISSMKMPLDSCFKHGAQHCVRPVDQLQKIYFHKSFNNQCVNFVKSVRVCVKHSIMRTKVVHIMPRRLDLCLVRGYSDMRLISLHSSFFKWFWGVCTSFNKNPGCGNNQDSAVVEIRVFKPQWLDLIGASKFQYVENSFRVD